MLLKDHLFTSESVSDDLPEICNQISDAILDAFTANDVKLGIADEQQREHAPGLLAFER